MRIPHALEVIAPTLALALAAVPRPAAAQRGTLDALIAPRSGRIVKYSSWDRAVRNDDFVRVAPGQTVTLVDHSGAGIVRRWWITIAPRNSQAIQRQLIVRCWWDGESTPSVEVPVSDFFGMSFGEWRDYQSVPLNMTSGGYNSYWAMPFRRAARITIENRSNVVIDRFYYNIDVESVPRLSDSTLYFHAQFRRATTAAGRPVTVLEAEGRGHYAGTLLGMQPLRGRSQWYLEGNERIFVDGETTPSIIGTGTEDYFSSGWYFDTGPYSAAYHGAPIKEDSTGRISAYRWHIEDPMPFSSRLRFEIEHGGTNDAPGTDYTSVAFWYQTHPHAAFPPLPADLMPAPIWRSAVRPTLPIEAETLVTKARATAGTVRVQEMYGLESDSAGWSGGKQLWWVESRPGARMTIPLHAARAGEYELIGWFTTAQDYGRARLSLDGRALSPIVEGYAPRVGTTGAISFGRVQMRAGRNDLVVEILGKDPRSRGYSDGYLVGIDGFALRR